MLIFVTNGSTASADEIFTERLWNTLLGGYTIILESGPVEKRLVFKRDPYRKTPTVIVQILRNGKVNDEWLLKRDKLPGNFRPNNLTRRIPKDLGDSPYSTFRTVGRTFKLVRRFSYRLRENLWTIHLDIEDTTPRLKLSEISWKTNIFGNGDIQSTFFRQKEPYTITCEEAVLPAE